MFKSYYFILQTTRFLQSDQKRDCHIFIYLFIQYNMYYRLMHVQIYTLL
jgi:hypothetical protein